MTLPVAGWYDDPSDAQLLRWWTGTEWSDATERRLVAPPVPPVAPVEPSVEPSVADVSDAEPLAKPVAKPTPEPTVEPNAEPEAPLPYGPASTTGVGAAVGATASATGPTGPPPLPPFAVPAQPSTQPGTQPAGPVALPATPATSSFAQLRRGNPLAFTGVLVGLVALVFNPLGGLGLLTLIFGTIGLVRALELKRRGTAVTGLGWAIVALALGGIAALRLLGNFVGLAL
jgi:hypothetical protein